MVEYMFHNAGKEYRRMIGETLIPLARADWEGYRLPFHYRSDVYYDVDVKRSQSDFQVSFVKNCLRFLMKKRRMSPINFSNPGASVSRHGGWSKMAVLRLV